MKEKEYNIRERVQKKACNLDPLGGPYRGDKSRPLPFGVEGGHGHPCVRSFLLPPVPKTLMRMDEYGMSFSYVSQPGCPGYARYLVYNT